MVLVSFRYSYGEFQSVKSQVHGTGICTTYIHRCLFSEIGIYLPLHNSPMREYLLLCQSVF